MTILNGSSTVLEVNSSGASDVTPPVLQTAATSVDGLTITLTYNESLDTGSTPATGDFSTSPSKTISNVNVTGSTVVLTVSVAFGSGDTITLDYTAASNPIQDTAGNDAANLSGQSVTNNVSSGFLPSDISSLVAWYETSGLATNTNNSYGTVDASNNITTWKDLSGNGHNLDGTGHAPNINTGDDNAIQFNGTTEYLENTSTLVTSEMAGDTSGEFMIVAKYTSGTGNFSYLFSVANSGSDNNRLNLGLSSSDKRQFSWRDTSANNSEFGTHTDFDFVIQNISSNGTRYLLYEDGVSVAHDSGTDNGNWTGDLGGSIDSFAVGSLRDSSPNYWQVDVKALFYFSSELSTGDRSSMLTYLNNAYSVY